MQNPITGDDLTKREAEYVAQLRAARSGARKAARSGHPGRRAEAQRALSRIPALIAHVYRNAGVAA